MICKQYKKLHSKSSSSLLNSILKSFKQAQTLKNKCNASTSTIDQKLFSHNSTQTDSCSANQSEEELSIKFSKMNETFKASSSTLSSLSVYEKELCSLKTESISHNFDLKKKQMCFIQNKNSYLENNNNNNKKSYYLKPIELNKRFKIVNNPFFERILKFNETEDSSNRASDTSIVSSAYSFDSITPSQKHALKSSLKKARKALNNESVISNLGIEVISLLKENLIKKSESIEFEQNKFIYPCQICSSDTPIGKYRKSGGFPGFLSRRLSLQENSKLNKN